MKLTVFNGSGRGKTGNTAIMLEAFLRGFNSNEGNTSDVHVLMHISNMETFTQAFTEAEMVLLAFPMYTDMVPGIVKAFIETLEPYCGRQNNPAMVYLIHCGFPEVRQLRALEAYLGKLSRRLGCLHVGTILKGNSEGMQYIPKDNLLSDKNLQQFEKLGKTLGKTGELDKDIISALSQPEVFPGWMTAIFKLLSILGIADKGWDKQLKQNGVYQNRFAKPDTDEK